MNVQELHVNDISSINTLISVESYCIYQIFVLFPFLHFWTGPGFMESDILLPGRKQNAKHPMWLIPCRNSSHFARSEGRSCLLNSKEVQCLPPRALLSRGRKRIDTQVSLPSCHICLGAVSGRCHVSYLHQSENKEGSLNCNYHLLPSRQLQRERSHVSMCHKAHKALSRECHCMPQKV